MRSTAWPSFWGRVASWALLGLPALLAFLVLVAALTPEDLPGDTVFSLAPAAVLGLVLGLSVRRWPRAAYPAAVFSLLLALMGGVRGAGFALRHPESFFDFAAAAGLLAGPAVALFATTTAIRRRFSASPEGPATQRARRVVGATAAVVLLAIAASGIVTAVRGPVVVRAGVAIDVLTARDRFLPDEFSVRRGETLTFRIHNEDSYAHTFSVDEAEVDSYIGPLADRDVKLTVPRSGASRLRLYCAIRGHEEMEGDLLMESS
jgi:uncharacterized cupredoxin-like copper-binding protein